MPSSGALQRFCALSIIAFSSFSQATDSLFEEVVPDFSARYQYIGGSADGQSELYMVWNGEVNGQTLPQFNTRATPLLVDTSTGTTQLLHIGSSGNLKTEVITQPRFNHDHSQVIYIADNALSGQSARLGTDWLHIYDIETGETEEIALPEIFNGQLRKLSAFPTPDSLYLTYQNDLVRLVYADNSIQYTPLPGGGCSGDGNNYQLLIKDVRDRGIFNNPCGSEVIAVDNNGDAERLFTSFLRSSNYRLDPNGEYIDYEMRYNFHYRWQFLTDTREVVSAASTEVSFFDSFTNAIGVSTDGRYRVYSARSSQIPGISATAAVGTWHFVVADGETEQFAVVELPRDNIETIPTQPTEIPGEVIFSDFSSESQVLSLNLHFPSEDATARRFDIALADLFTGPFPQISQFAPQSNEPLKVEFGDLGYDSEVLLVKRTQMSTGESQTFYLNSPPFTDYQLGLEPGDVQYQLLACRNNYICDTQSEPVTQTVNVSDFTTVPEFELFDFDKLFSFSHTGSFELRLTNPKPEGSTQNIYRYDVKGAHVAESAATASISASATQTTIEHDGPVKGQRIYLKNCISNHQNRHLAIPETSCSQNYSAVQQLDFAPNGELSLKTAADGSSAQLHWNSLTGASYTLTRTNTETQASQVLLESSEQTHFVDNELLDASVQYNLEVCAGSCTTYTLNREPVAQIATANHFAAIGHPALVEFRSNKVWDSYQLRRQISRSSLEDALLLEWQQDGLTYIDSTAVEGVEYDYQVMGCIDQECTEIASTQLQPQQQSERAPFPVKNLQGQASFLNYDLSWQQLDTSNLTAFEISYKPKNSSSWLRLTEMPDTARDFSIALTEQTAGAMIRVAPYRLVIFRADEFRVYAPYQHIQVPDIDASSLDLVNPVPLTLSTGPTGSTDITINAPAVADEFRLFMRGQNDEQFSEIAYLRKDADVLMFNTTLTHSIGAEYVGQTLEFYLESCSSWGGKCSQNNEVVSYQVTSPQGYQEFDDVVSLEAPTVEWTQEGLKVTVQPHEGADVIWTEYYRDGLRSNVSVTTGADSLIYRGISGDFSGLSPGDRVRWQTSYCYNGFRELFAGGYCTPSSDPVVFIIPEGRTLVPALPDLSNLSITNTLGEAQVNFDVDYSLSINNAELIATPEYIEILNQASDGELTLLQTVSLDAPLTGSVTVESVLSTGQYLNLVARVCNTNGCGELSNALAVNLYNDIIEIVPDSPQVTLSNVDQLNRTALVQFTRDDQATNAELIVSQSNSDPLSNVFQQFSLAQEQEIALSGFAAETDYFVFVRNCNLIGCSDFAAPITLRFDAQQATTTTISFDANNTDNPFVSGSPFILEQEGIPAFSGRLQAPQYLDFSNGVSLDMDVYFATRNSNLMALNFVYDWHHMVTQEHSETFSRLLTIDKSSSGDFILESRLWDSAITLPQQVNNRWGKIRFDIAADGVMSIYIDDVLLSSSDHAVEMGFFEWSKIMLDVSDAALGTMTVTSQAQREIDFAPFDFKAGSFTDDVLTSLFRHPEYIAYDTLSDAVTRIQIWQKDFSTGVYSQVLDADKAIAIAHLTAEYAQMSATSYGNLLRLCTAEFCLPGGWHMEEKPEYSSLSSWSAPVAEDSSVTFNLTASDDAYAQQFSLYRYTVGQSEPELLLMGQFTNLVTEAANDGSYTLEVTPAETSHNYALQICNPLGCLENVNSNAVLVPLPGDSDGDGVADDVDQFPNDPFESADTDGDGIGDNADTDADNDGLSDEVEIRIGTDPNNANDGLNDSDGDGFADLYENLSGSGINDFNNIPSDVGYFESFETAKSDYLSFYVTGFSGKPIQFIDETRFPIDESRTNEGIHGAEGYLFEPAKHPLVSAGTANASGADIYYRGFVKSGTVWFAVKDHQGDPRVRVGNRQISFDENDIIPVGNDFTLYTFQLANSDQRTSEVVIHIPGDAFTLDGVFLPGGRPCNTGSAGVAYDFNCDGQAELAGTFIGQGMEHLHKTIVTNDVNRTPMTNSVNFTFIPVSGDFDGDGIMEPGIRGIENTTWYIRRSSDNELMHVFFGMQEQDIPVVGDYDGDGKSDIAVRRPSNTTWYVKKSSDGDILRIKFGLQPTDIPVPGDYDGDGITDPAVVRLSNRIWYIKYSSDGSIGRESVTFRDGEIPMAADMDGDGKSDLVIRRPALRSWWIKRSSDNQVYVESFGKQAADIPVVADYDGDGKDDLAVRRMSDFHFYVKRSSDGRIGRYVFGKSDDFIPLAAPVQLQMQFVQGDWSFIQQ